MTTIKCFVSYSWDNEAIAQLICSVIESLNHEPVRDRTLLNQTDPRVHDTIAQHLLGCDVCVVLLTPQSAQSHEVREELTLAWHWRIPILIVHDTALERALFPRILRDHDVAVQFDPLDRVNWLNDLSSRLKDALSKLLDHHPFRSQTTMLQMREIRTSLNDMRSTDKLFADIPSFRHRVLKEVLLETQKEVTNLVANNWSQDLSLERTFIVRAGPIFRSAQRAVCD
jgi:hypothetical protein